MGSWEVTVMWVTVFVSEATPASAQGRRRDEKVRCQPEHRPRGNHFHANVRGRVRELLRQRLARATTSYGLAIERVRRGLQELRAKLPSDSPDLATAVSGLLEESRKARLAAEGAADRALWGLAREVADAARAETATAPTQSTKGEDP